MLNRDLAKVMLKLHEGVKPHPYTCSAGKWTIGVGRNFQDNPFMQSEIEQLGLPVSFSSQKNFLFAHWLSNEQIDWLLDSTMDKIMADMVEVPEISVAFHRVDEVRQACLIDLAFTLGVPGLKKFQRFLDAMAVKDFKLAAKELINSRWYRQVGHRGVRITNMIKTGDIPVDLLK